MFLKKIFCFICAIFLFQNLYDVYKDSYSVQYVIEKNKTGNDIVFSFCIELNKKLLENFNSLNNQYQFKVEDLVRHTCDSIFSKFICNNLIDLKESYLFNYHSCLIFNNSVFDILINNLTLINFNIFIISNYKSNLYPYENIFSNRFAAFKLNNKLDPFSLNVKFNIFYQLERPYQTNCFNYSNENVNFKSKELIYSRISCLNECYKSESKSRSLNYYYSRRDDELLIITLDDLNQFKGIGQKRILDKNLTNDIETKCKKVCKEVSCTSNYYSVNQFKNIKQTKFNLTYDLKIFKAIPSTTNFQFIINFISLIVLFLNISFYETMPYLIKKIFSIYFRKYLGQFNKYYWLVKLTIFILCLIIVINLSIFRIIDYKNADYNQLEAFNFPTEIIPFYLMICVPIQILIHSNINRLDKHIESDLLNTKSFMEIENLTDFSKFETNLDRIYIQYGTFKKPIDFKIDRTKIVFRNFNYKNHIKSNFLLRCFKIDFNFKELRYEMLFSLSKLIIILKFNYYIVYPLAKNQNLSTLEPKLNSEDNFHLIKYEKKFRCLDYSKNKSIYNFSSLTNMIDNCVINRHLKIYNNLTIQSVIYKEMISSNYKLNKIYFNYSLDENIKNECSKQFKLNHCFTHIFKIDEIKSTNQVNNKFSMYIYFPEYIIKDNLVLTLSDLLLNNLFSFECIFIGLNIGKFLFILFVLLKKSKFNRILKYYNYLKILIILFGLSFNFHFIINDILKGEKIIEKEIQTSKIFQLPNLFFCIQFNQNKIDLNHKQTTNYLDKLTKNLSLNLFQNITLINENGTVVFEPIEESTFKYFKIIKILYFLNLKCFEFTFNRIKINKYKLNDNNFVNIKFNKTKILEYFNCSSFEFYFITKKIDTDELNGINKIRVDFNNNNPLIIIKQELIILENKEKFFYIKNPFAIFNKFVNLDDTTNYTTELINDFQEFNLKTKRIPTISKDPRYRNDKDGNLEIDDELFDQYFYQIKNVTDYNSLRILDFRREFYFTHITESETQNNDDYNLKFFFTLEYKKYLYTNRDNDYKFIIAILNCLNTWLNFCCFDTYIYLKKFCYLFYKFYQIFLGFKFYLYQKKITFNTL